MSDSQLGAVYIEGLSDLRYRVRKIDPRLQRGIRIVLKEAAEIVAVEARDIAPEGPTGDLKHSIRAFTRGNYAGVRAPAVRVSRAYPQGYPYPRRLEFEGGIAGTIRGVGGTTPGPRAFLAPALENKHDEVVERVARLLDDIADVWES